MAQPRGECVKRQNSGDDSTCGEPYAFEEIHDRIIGLKVGASSTTQPVQGGIPVASGLRHQQSTDGSFTYDCWVIASSISQVQFAGAVIHGTHPDFVFVNYENSQADQTPSPIDKSSLSAPQ